MLYFESGRVKNKMRKGLFTVLVLLMLAGAVSAFTPSQFVRGSGVPTVDLTGEISAACAVFTWTQPSAADNNSMILKTTSTVSAYNGLDENITTGIRRFCTLASGETITATVYRVDGNASGLFLNVTDTSVTVGGADATQAGTFLFYNILAAIAGLAGLIVLVSVITIMLLKLGFLKILKL